MISIICSYPLEILYAGLRKSGLFILNDSQASRWGEEGAGGGHSPPPAPSSPVSAFGVSSQRVQRLLRSPDQKPGLLQRWAYCLPSGVKGAAASLRRVGDVAISRIVPTFSSS